MSGLSLWDFAERYFGSIFLRGKSWFGLIGFVILSDYLAVAIEMISVYY